MGRIFLLDTNLLCCLLEVKGKSVVGNGDIWNKSKIEAKIAEIEKANEGIVIPLPMMIETGNLIGHAYEYNTVRDFVVLLRKTFDPIAPFHDFNEQHAFWDKDALDLLIEKWTDYAPSGVGLGDYLLILLAHHLRVIHEGHDIEILTGDNELLKSYSSIEYDDVKKLCKLLYSSEKTGKPLKVEKRSLRRK